MKRYSHLSCDEREEIALLHFSGQSQSSIAKQIGRSKSTISRELKRHRTSAGRYSARFAQGGYLLARQRCSLLQTSQRLQEFVFQRLSEAWSPQQISGWLRNGVERGLTYVNTESIYAWIYSAEMKSQELWRFLTRRHKKRRPMLARVPKSTIKGRNSIHERPESVNKRAEFGDWECDYILCNRTRPVLVLHERKSRFTLAAKLTGRTAAETAATLMAIFGKLDPKLRKSVTFDNDTGFAKHALLKDMYNVSTWFCDAYASWQKGAVENTNGRLRTWLPRNLDIDKVPDEELQEVVMTLNLTPRKCLNYKTPLQALFDTSKKQLKITFA